MTPADSPLSVFESEAAGPVGLSSPAKLPTFRESFPVWCQIAALSFGGPAGQIAVMHRFLVEQRRWIREQDFLQALQFCTLLPGPEAQQLATFLGWKLHGVRGGLTAGLLFILPGFVSLLVLSLLYVWAQDRWWLRLVFDGLQPAVLAIVLDALRRMLPRVLQTPTAITMACLAVIALSSRAVPYPLVLLIAAMLANLLPDGWWSPTPQPPNSPEIRSSGDHENSIGPAIDRGPPRPSLSRTLLTATVWLLIWWGPLVAVVALTGSSSIYSQQALFFSWVAVVTFGGAYAVLDYVRVQVVEHYGWLSVREMQDGLGLAETTPGPLIMVLQFVGSLAAWRAADGPWQPLAGLAGALVTVWATFAPCFLWVFVGAPWVEWIQRFRWLQRSLAAVLCVAAAGIMNLAIAFAGATLLRQPAPQSLAELWHHDWTRPLELNPAGCVLTIGAITLLVGRRGGLVAVIAGCVVGRIVWAALGWQGG